MTTFLIAIAAVIAFTFGHWLGSRRGFVEGIRFGRLLQMASSETSVPPPPAGVSLDAYRREVERIASQQ